MRVVSFILSFLLAATTSTSLVAAAAIPSAPSTDSGSSNNAAIIGIISHATEQMKPLRDKLTSASSGNPDSETVKGVANQMAAVLSTAGMQLQALPQSDNSSGPGLGGLLDGLLNTVGDLLSGLGL